MASKVKAVEMLVKVLCPHDAKCGMAVSHLEKLKILLVFRSLIRTFARMMMEWQRLKGLGRSTDMWSGTMTALSLSATMTD